MYLIETQPGQKVVLAVSDDGLPINTFKAVPAECFVSAKRSAEVLCLWDSKTSRILGNRKANNADLKLYLTRNYGKYSPLIPDDDKYNALAWFMGARLCKLVIRNENQFCIFCKSPAPHSDPNLADNLYSCQFCSVFQSL